VADLQAIGNNLSGTYALGRDINNGGAGNFTPIGMELNYYINQESGYTLFPFTGIFDGEGHVVSNLTNSLFGKNSGIIRNVGVTGAISDDTVATYFGQNSGATAVGGLAALNTNLISNSFSAMSVTSTSTPGYIGGLVGQNTGTIQYSYATG